MQVEKLKFLKRFLVLGKNPLGGKEALDQWIFEASNIMTPIHW